MKCKECKCCKKGWFRSSPDTYVCIGVKHPFEIKDINVECTEYEEYRNKKHEVKIEHAMHYRDYQLNLDKINSIDDCKKVLKFLCDLTIKPTPEDVGYNGFKDVEEYFED